MFGYWRYENTQFDLLNVRRDRATFEPFKKTQQKKVKNIRYLILIMVNCKTLTKINAIIKTKEEN